MSSRRQSAVVSDVSHTCAYVAKLVVGLTAKKVPGRKTIVTRDIDLMTFESWFVATAISTAVSLWDCDGQLGIEQFRSESLPIV
jgi:hypothetical protein